MNSKNGLTKKKQTSAGAQADMLKCNLYLREKKKAKCESG